LLFLKILDSKEGKMSDFDLNTYGDATQDTSSMLALLFDDYFYTIKRRYVFG